MYFYSAVVFSVKASDETSPPQPLQEDSFSVGENSAPGKVYKLFIPEDYFSEFPQIVVPIFHLVSCICPHLPWLPL